MGGGAERGGAGAVPGGGEGVEGRGRRAKTLKHVLMCGRKESATIRS